MESKELHFLYEMTTGEFELSLGNISPEKAEVYEDSSLRAISESTVVEWIQEGLKSMYVYSEVTSGEFIHGEILYGYALIPENIIREGVQAFLDWDESPEEFELEFDDQWKIK
jgi:hypothetical protein